MTAVPAARRPSQNQESPEVPMSPTDPAPAAGPPAPDPFAAADASILAAPLPLPRTVRRRSSLPIQLWRFVLINVKIVRMVLKGHH